MTYQETVNWMFSQLPMYQHQGASAYKKDLTNTILLAGHLGNPERKIKCIHVAGTNGKGSTSHMLASILMEAGYKTGLYTSPHLRDFRERIKIDGVEIPEEFIVRFIEKHKSFFEQQNLSFFEMTVGLAFDYFATEQIDVAIIETGLGGRLDSTNIISPILSVITNIGFDHMQFLGNSLEAIAAEKAGIIKPETPVVIGEYLPETRRVFETKAASVEADIYFAQDRVNENFESDLLGDYQAHNKNTVVQAIKVLQERQLFTISQQHIADGLMHVTKNTGLYGRWQQLNSNPTVIADTAHNSHGLKIVIRQIERQSFDKLHIVLGVVNDKDLADILPLFPKTAEYYFCKPNIPRGLDAENLKDACIEFGLSGRAYPSVSAAYDAAIGNAAPTDFIYIGGSTFVVAEIL